MSKKSASIRWSEQQLAEFAKRSLANSAPKTVASAQSGAAVTASTPKERLQALGRLKTGERNKTEAEYEELLKADPTVVWFMFEGIKLRLADNTTYTPDFFLMRRSGLLEAHEVKGHWQDDARVKIKVAASMFPIKFVAVQKIPKKQGGGWKSEEF